MLGLFYSNAPTVSVFVVFYKSLPEASTAHFLDLTWFMVAAE